MIVKNTILKMTKNLQYLPKWWIWLGLVIFTLMAILLTHNIDLFHTLEQLISRTENYYQQWG